MGNTKYDYFDRHFDVDGMLYETAKWLGEQVNLPTREFVEIAEQLDLRQEDWTRFWRGVNKRRLVEEKKFECIILGKGWLLSEDEFDFVKQLLGDPTEEISNCCGASVYPHNPNDYTSRCSLCKEGCKVVYVWEGNTACY